MLLPEELDEIEKEFMNYYNTTQIIWDNIAINNLFDKYFENVLCYLNYCSLEEFYYNRATLHNYDRINVARLDRGELDVIEDVYINLDL